MIYKLMKKKDAGFTYLSLIIGISMLLLAVGFFMKLYKTSGINMYIAKEKMAMSTVAQNVAQVYMATNDRDTAIDEDENQGYTVELDVTPADDGLKKVKITVNPILDLDPSDQRAIEKFILVFEMPEPASE